MAKIVVRGEVVYKCNVCNRKIRVADNPHGLSVIHHCTITANCKGVLSKTNDTREILSTSTIPVELSGVQNWYQRRLVYNHTQAIATQKWIIQHNLSNNPIFSVYVDTGNNTQQEIAPLSITTIDNNTSELTFNKPYSGIAQAISLSSQLQVDKSTPLSDAYFQVSNSSGVLTIATLDNSDNLKADFAFKVKASNTPITLSYIVTNQPVSNTAWVDTSSLYINNKSYTTRTVNMVLDPSNYHYFASGDISQNSSVALTQIDDIVPSTQSIILLLSTSPHGTADKIYNKFVYLSGVTDVSKNLLIYKNGTFFAHTSIIRDIYPYIHVV